jgi:hypothetical protein
MIEGVHYQPEQLLDGDHLRRLVSKAITARLWLGFRPDDPEKARSKWRVIGYAEQQEELDKLIAETAK